MPYCDGPCFERPFLWAECAIAEITRADTVFDDARDHVGSLVLEFKEHWHRDFPDHHVRRTVTFKPDVFGDWRPWLSALTAMLGVTCMSEMRGKFARILMRYRLNQYQVQEVIAVGDFFDGHKWVVLEPSKPACLLDQRPTKMLIDATDHEITNWLHAYCGWSGYPCRVKSATLLPGALGTGILLKLAASDVIRDYPALTRTNAKTFPELAQQDRTDLPDSILIRLRTDDELRAAVEKIKAVCGVTALEQIRDCPACITSDFYALRHPIEPAFLSLQQCDGCFRRERLAATAQTS